jgi:L-arabinose isomerase
MVGQAKKAGMGVKILEVLSDGEALWREFIESYAFHFKTSECTFAEPHPNPTFLKK